MQHAPGFRYYPSGVLNGVGNHGYSWSAASSGIRGLELYFRSQYLDPSLSDYRAHGFQLRCLSE